MGRGTASKVLDDCENDGEAACPIDGGRALEIPRYAQARPEIEGNGVSDTRIVNMLKKLQPSPALDLQSTVSTEKIDGVVTIRGRLQGW